MSEATANTGDHPDNIEHSFDTLKSLIAGLAQPHPADFDATEQIIKPILTGALDWCEADLTPCGTVSPPFKCIRLCTQDASRAALVIHDGPLGLAGRNTDRPYQLQGPVLGSETSEAAPGIRQACLVCGLKNCELACVTNGQEWIIFRGSRIGDGKDTLEGLAFVFPDLASIETNFKLFYDLLSKGPVTVLHFRAHFQEAEGQPIRSHTFSRTLRLPETCKPIERDQLARDLDRVMESFFQRLTGDQDPQMLSECFVVTKESEIAEHRIARISEDLINRIQTLDAASADALTDLIHKVHVSQRNEFVLLVGTKGAGKSTFMDRFFKLILPADIKKECLVVKVDLKDCHGSEASVVDWLNDTLLQNAERAIYDEQAPSYDEIQGMFFDEYTRWRTGSYQHLYDKDKEEFKIEFGRHIEKKREERPHDYICRLMGSIVRSRKKAPCLVFDNADHFSIEFQEKVFQYARSIYEREVCLVVMPITDKTSWQLSRQGALQSFDSVSLFLPTPSPKTVLERRIKYLDEKVSDEDEERGRGYFLGQGIQLELTHLKAFASCLQHVFLETGRASVWVGNLANMDIRRSLRLTRDIMSSPYMRVEELLKAYIASSSAVIPLLDVQRAIIRRQYTFYPVGNNEFVQNIYSLRTEIGTSPLLGLRILTALRDAQHSDVQGREAFMGVTQLYEYFQSMTVERRVVSLWLDDMLRTGLVLSYDPTLTSIDNVQKVELSPAGKQHLLWGANDETYVGSMLPVTPIFDQGTYDKLRGVPWGNRRYEWAAKLCIFLNYLLAEDAAYVRIPDHEAFDGQRKLLRGLSRLHRYMERDVREMERHRRGRRDQPHHRYRRPRPPALVREGDTRNGRGHITSDKPSQEG